MEAIVARLRLSALGMTAVFPLWCMVSVGQSDDGQLDENIIQENAGCGQAYAVVQVLRHPSVWFGHLPAR